MSEKTYINGLYIKKKTFSNGGDAINVSFQVEKFIEELRKHSNSAGYANFTFQNRKEADEKGNNMYAILDTYKPEKK
jgi:hypothetical protein